MSNEAKTMNLFRKLLKEKGYYSTCNVEEQQSDNVKIKRLLKNASKGGDGCGFPDFIIRSDKYPDLVIVVECKADIRKHESSTLDSYKDYAIDGALLYSSFLSKEFDVIAIGFSGEKENLCTIGHYIQIKGCKEQYKYFSSNELLTIKDYGDGLNQSTYKFNQDFENLIQYTKDINEELKDKKIKEAKRGILISGIMIALKNERFKAEYKNYESTNILVKNLYDSICNELDKSDIPDRNKLSLKGAYEFIKNNSSINNPTAKGHEYLVKLIDESDSRINGFMVTHKYIDTISQFYIEFLRYANNDKGLGIVLTPPHITELFVELAEVNKDSVVVDNCAGTGGFLVSAMKKMLTDANGDISKESHIKDKQLLGIEYDDEIYALLISNMIIHRDGRTNISLGDCFELDIKKIKKEFRPNIGLLNPPYKNKGKGIEEMEFILNNLSILEKGGRCVAIIPISCVNDITGMACTLKSKLLASHTLEGVLSLPEELFVNSKVNTVTCAVIVTAGVPHPENKKTWFGYCRNDGFVKKKNRGRIDAANNWKKIKDEWVSAFINREVIDNFSVMKHVNANMEWCAEAYLQPDYKSITIDDYKDVVKNFLLFNLKSKQIDDVEEVDYETM